MATDKENDDIKGSKIDVFGVKLDLFQTIIGIIAGGAALGTGYLLYNDIQKNNLAEQAKKQQEQYRQAQYLSYLREQERKNTLINKPTVAATVAEDEEPENSRLDMNIYRPNIQPPPTKVSYSDILTQSEQANPNNPYAYNMYSSVNDYNASFNSRHAPPPEPQQEPASSMINMGPLINNPDMEVQQQPPPPPPPMRQQPRQTEATEQENQQELDDLYKSMNNY